MAVGSDYLCEQTESEMKFEEERVKIIFVPKRI